MLSRVATMLVAVEVLLMVNKRNWNLFLKKNFPLLFCRDSRTGEQSTLFNSDSSKTLNYIQNKTNCEDSRVLEIRHLCYVTAAVSISVSGLPK